VATDARCGLVEANVRAFLLTMGRAGGGDERNDDEVAWTVGGSPIDYHNAVVACSASPDRAGALIDEWSAELEARGVPGCWHLTPAMAPSDLADRLLARGYEDGGEEPAMVADLAVPMSAVSPVDGLRVEPVGSAAELEDYRGVLARGFGEGPPEAAWVADVFRRLGLGEGGPWRHLVGRLDGQAVATVTLFVHPAAVAGVYFVATVPEARRRGIGAAVTSAALREARDLGCATAVLGSSPMGHALYERLGFEEVFRYRLLERSSAGASQRTTSSSSPVSTS
jgi:ribosomal protein S18 acetylase RimI-like enzyme